MMAREFAKLAHLFICQNIACGVGWTGNGDGAHVAGDFQSIKVHVILESPITDKRDAGPVGVKKIGAHPNVSVADVFWRKRQKDPSVFALPEVAGKKLEQQIKRTFNRRRDLFKSDELKKFYCDENDKKEY